MTPEQRQTARQYGAKGEVDRAKWKVASLIGKRYGRLTVIGHIGPKADRVKKTHYWLCECSCVSRKLLEVTVDNLKSDGVISCGCVRDEKVSQLSRRHGMSRSPTWSSWMNMINRCRYEYDCWHVYQGVTVCERWQKFENFYADLGEKPRGCSIDRIQNDGGYWCGKSDCLDCGPLKRVPNGRWATQKQQTNNKSVNRRLTFAGETHTVAEWAEITGLNRKALYARLDLGFDAEKALTQPPRTGESISSRFNAEWEMRVAEYMQRGKGSATDYVQGDGIGTRAGDSSGG